jgi:hypothetical protein
MIKHAQPALYTFSGNKILIVNVHMQETHRNPTAMLTEVKKLMNEIKEYCGEQLIKYHIIVGDFNIGGKVDLLKDIDTQKYNVFNNHNMCLIFSKNITMTPMKIGAPCPEPKVLQHNVMVAELEFHNDNLPVSTYVMKERVDVSLDRQKQHYQVENKSQSSPQMPSQPAKPQLKPWEKKENATPESSWRSSPQQQTKSQSIRKCENSVKCHQSSPFHDGNSCFKTNTCSGASFRPLRGGNEYEFIKFK